MLSGWYARWMTDWETDLTTRDTNRIVRPLEWGFDWLADSLGDGGRVPGAKEDAEKVVSGMGRDFSPGITGAESMRALAPATRFSPLSAQDSPSSAAPEGRCCSEKAAGGAALAEQKGDCAGPATGANSAGSADRDRMIALNQEIVRRSEEFFGYATPPDFRIERRHPQLFPTNVRPETLAREQEMRRQAASGELEEADFLRFTSPVRTRYPENDQVNARWYPAPEKHPQAAEAGHHRHAAVERRRLQPQPRSAPSSIASASPRCGFPCPTTTFAAPPSWSAPTTQSSANIGRTIAACRQAVVDIRSCLDWLEAQGYDAVRRARHQPGLLLCLHRRRPRPAPAHLRVQPCLHLVRRRGLDRAKHAPRPRRV